MTLTPPSSPTRRDRWGRYLVVDPETGKLVGLTRATTISGSLDDKTNLVAWKARTAVVGIATRPDLVALAAATDPTDKRALDDIVERASDAGGASLRRDLGTAVHGFFAASVADPAAPIWKPYDADVSAIFAAIDAAGFDIVAGMVERMVVMWRHGIAGTFDLLLRDRWTGTLYVADLKTGSSLLGALGFATQLSIYAQADVLYQQGAKADGSEDITDPMPEVSQSLGFILHCQPGTGHCDIHALDLTIGAEALELAMNVREMRKAKVLTPAPIPDAVVDAAVAQVLEVFPGAEVVTHVDNDWRAWMTSRIQAIKDAGHIEALAIHWPAVPTIPSGDPITIDQGAEIEAAVRLIEQQFEMPFPEPLTKAAAPKPKPAAAKRRPRPDEGPDVDEAMVASVNERAKQLEPDAIAWVAEMLGAASKANYPIRLTGAGSKRTLRRWYIASALVTLAGFADQALNRALISLAIGEELQPGHNVAAAIGSMTIDEAQRLMRLAAAVADSSLTPIWGEDTVTVTGDIQAALAA